jgi:hypothetical protein
MQRFSFLRPDKGQFDNSPVFQNGVPVQLFIKVPKGDDR